MHELAMGFHGGDPKDHAAPQAEASIQERQQERQQQQQRRQQQNPDEVYPRNPHNPTYLAGGSSGGSAVAVASGAVTAALGTDTSGSVRIPPAFCGVIGFRPSPGRYADSSSPPAPRKEDGSPTISPLPPPVSEVYRNASGRRALLQLSPTVDTLGIIARTVTDVQCLDAVLRGQSLPEPQPQREQEEGEEEEESKADQPLHGLRFGVPHTHYREDNSRVVDTAFQLALQALEKAGAELVFEAMPPESRGRIRFNFDRIFQFGPGIVSYECFHALRDYCQDIPENSSIPSPSKDGPNEEKEKEVTAESIISEIRSEGIRSRFKIQMEAAAEEEDSSSGSGGSRFGKPGIPGPVTRDTYEKALQEREELREAFRVYLREHRLDGFLYPTTSTHPRPLVFDWKRRNAPKLRVDAGPIGIRWATSKNAFPSALAGCPSITLPSGSHAASVPGEFGEQSISIPLAVELCCGEDEDDRLLELAARIHPVLPPPPRPSLETLLTRWKIFGEHPNLTAAALDLEQREQSRKRSFDDHQRRADQSSSRGHQDASASSGRKGWHRASRPASRSRAEAIDEEEALRRGKSFNWSNYSGGRGRHREDDSDRRGGGGGGGGRGWRR